MNILVTGPESTGKSTISQFIADEYEAELITEYARTYLSKNGPGYTQEDLLTIAKHHYELYTNRDKKDICVCDSFLLNIKIWSEYKYGSCDPWIIEHVTSIKFDLVLLTSTDIPWAADPLRENPLNRDELFMIFKKELDAIGQQYVVLKSDKEAREKQVKQLINAISF